MRGSWEERLGEKEFLGRCNPLDVPDDILYDRYRFSSDIKFNIQHSFDIQSINLLCASTIWVNDVKPSVDNIQTIIPHVPQGLFFKYMFLSIFFFFTITINKFDFDFLAKFTDTSQPIFIVMLKFP